MDFSYAKDFGVGALPEAYERLLLDALQGDASLFTRADEIELAWELIDPLMGSRDPHTYGVGSWGPRAAAELLADCGGTWHHGCGGSEVEEGA